MVRILTRSGVLFGRSSPDGAGPQKVPGLGLGSPALGGVCVLGGVLVSSGDGA